MAINKKLIHFKNKENFDNEVANGNILDNSIVFIQDSKEISTHGTVYKTVNWSVLETPGLYEWIDLGLPSGTLWSAWNVGATKPEESGLFFAWGETEGYIVYRGEGSNSGNTYITDANGNETDKKFVWTDYKWCNGSETTLTKYNNYDSLGTVDNLTVLELVDDAAYVSDNSCRIPTSDECQELIDNTTLAVTSVNGVNGIQLTSKVDTSKSIFIPEAAYVLTGALYDSIGCIWSSSLDSEYPIFALNMKFSYGEVYMDYSDRFSGNSVRPVKSKS